MWKRQLVVKVLQHGARVIAWWGVVLFLLGNGLAPGAASAQDQEDVLVVPAGGEQPDVATVTQDIRIEGTVAGDVTSWSGDIFISGNVGGDVVSYAGQITLAPGAHVGGHVMAPGGRLQVAAGALVAGQRLEVGGGSGALASLLELFVAEDSAAPGAGNLGNALFGAAFGVLLLAFSMLWVAFWPRRTATACITLQRVPGRALALGLMTTAALALVLLPLVALLAATLIGIPVVVLVFVLVQSLYIYGLAALVRLLGMRLAGGSLGWAPEIDRATVASALLLVLLIAIVAVLDPLWGLVLFYVLASPGLGAAILSRGGVLLPLRAQV